MTVMMMRLWESKTEPILYKYMNKGGQVMVEKDCSQTKGERERSCGKEHTECLEESRVADTGDTMPVLQ